MSCTINQVCLTKGTVVILFFENYKDGTKTKTITTSGGIEKKVRPKKKRPGELAADVVVGEPIYFVRKRKHGVVKQDVTSTVEEITPERTGFLIRTKNSYYKIA